MAWRRNKKEETQETKARELPKIYSKSQESREEEAPRQQVGIARIISAELLDKGFRYVIISNKSLGQVGEEFPVD